jgi:hypothetical protein
MYSLHIRKMTANDIGLIRKLPVQLAHPAVTTLIPRKLRVLLQDRNFRMVIAEHERKVTAFAALCFSPSRDSSINFLVINYFATDRFAMSQGVAAELEAQATELARSNGSAGVLVGSDKLGRAALGFYKDRGYVLNGNTLIKELKWA